jgi:hypothetical protein
MASFGTSSKNFLSEIYSGKVGKAKGADDISADDISVDKNER